MKTLILTVSAGYGHNSTAAAVSNVFSENGNECVTVDICYHVNKAIGFAIEKGYLFSVDKLSKLYSLTYGRLLKRKAGKKDVTVLMAKYLSGKFKDYITEFAPDTVICTHVFGAMVIQNYIKEGWLKAKTFGILTDYTLHPYWEETTMLDYIVIPNERLAHSCIERGFREEQILPIGVPIQNKFSSYLTKEEARKELGLMTDKTVITVMSGSMCYGGLTETVKALDNINRCFQIIAICGSAEKELQKLEKEHFRHKVLKLGFTDKVNVIMDASDLIITKPGGLSTSEALSRELPMILTHPIPGHEERNLDFMVSNNAALTSDKNEPIDSVVKHFLSDSALAEELKEGARALSKKRAAEALFEIASK